MAQAQGINAYRSKANAHYWGHQKPDAAYWQQDVAYKIDARIDETTHIIEASQVLEYVNNSPDTLTFVYFHLFQNSFVKGSHLRSLEKAVQSYPRLGEREKNGLGTVIEKLKVDGQEVRTELDNTILKVYLPKPLLPNSSVQFTMDFTTYYDNGGSTRRRMKMYPAWGFMHYNGVQWFPKICVYDRKFGWDTYQHMNKEFYGDFGTFDVSLDFASNYIVEATGAIQNREEVLPKELREKLDVRNFASKKWNEPPSVIIPYKKGERKTWRFHAENVHDFAFTADPSYRIATAYWQGVECVGLAQEPHAAQWQNSAELVAKIIETFSTDIGMYAYPKMVAADAADGMEYPMLTLDGGGEPGYRGLLVHEIAHNWFYGMVGSNETYRAAMDEGFTQFLTAWGLNRIDGKYLKANGPPRSKYRRKFYEPADARDNRAYNAYVANALKGEPRSLNTHSNDFNNALHHEGGYGMVYYKTATMLYNLQYVLGDSLFLAAMQHYFDQWKMAHPYFEDFKNSVIQFTKVDLNWFFDEWFETTKKIDYSVNSIKKIRGTDSFAIHFRRKGQMEMPVDFTVTEKNGTQQSYHIPNTWFVRRPNTARSKYFIDGKQVEREPDLKLHGGRARATENEIALPKWYGWDKLHDTYTAVVSAPSGVKQVVIDTTNRLADIYLLDNTKAHGLPFRLSSMRMKWDGGMNGPADRYKYRLYVRPDLWWNPVDGIKAGAHIEGNYMNFMHRLDAGIWWNTHILQGEDYLSYESERYYQRYSPVNFTFNYISPVSYNHPNHEEQLNVRYIDGLAYGRIGHNWRPTDNVLAQLYFQTMWRPLTYDLDYLIYPHDWSSNQKRPNNSLNVVLSRSYNTKRSVGSATATFRAPLLAGNNANAFNYSYIQLELKNSLRLHKLELRSRLFGRAGMGVNLPYESALWLSGANPEDLMENKYTRSIGLIPQEWRGISPYDMNHFQMGGGLNLRGYAGYFIADERNGETLIGYKGRSGASLNLELDFDDYIRLQPKFTRNWLHIDAYAFADAGVIELSRVNNVTEYYNAAPTTMVSDLRMDAGLGFAATIRKWGVFEKAQPLTIRFDMPLFINRPPYGAPQYFGFRYVVGINRSF
ncbi:MAG TPA: M1 family metallopeptidase [Flavipsychrobacter sp.]|nr:M1 family metallopeptidase [Flavipsychrobacter sp.]